MFPGGRVDPEDWDGEPVDDLRDPRMLDAARRAAVREAAEETGAIVDPSGHEWQMATHKEDVAPDEMMKRMQAQV